MKNHIKSWKQFLLKEENELDIPLSPEAMPDQSPTVVHMREILREVQSMATRLIEIQDDLKEKYRNDDIGYFPGHEFSIAARALADEEEWGSLAAQLNRFIVNEVDRNKGSERYALDKPSPEESE
jgi:hypothetical protein